MYVALSCLVQQLKTESRADVFTVVRKLRSQRQGMIQNVVSTTSHHEKTYIYVYKFFHKRLLKCILITYISEPI